MINTGTDCYFISAFQLLRNIHQIMDYIRNSKSSDLTKYEKIFLITDRLLNKGKEIEMFSLLNTVNKDMFDGSQRDASEFITFLLENYVDKTPKLITQEYVRSCECCGYEKFNKESI